MAEMITRKSDKKETAEPAKKAAPAKKPAEAAKKAEPAKKPQTVVTPNKPTGGSTLGLRIGACVLWLLAIVCEVFAIMALLEYFYPPMSMTLFLILAIVVDMGLAIFAAQLWKKANHIKPMSEKRGKFLFYLWNELGVIMACICFIPLIVLLLKNDKLDKKTKLIATIVAVVALLITGVASADFSPISAEQKEEAEHQITGDVYWTQFGHKYHVYQDCGSIQNSKNVYPGTVTEAIEAGRTAMCQFCANRAEKEGMDLSHMNVEGRDASASSNNDLPIVNTTAPATTGGN